MTSGGGSIGRTYDVVVTVPLSVRAATGGDIDALQVIREEVAVDLLERGIPWNPNSTRRDHLEAWMADGALWVATSREEVVGMLALWWEDPARYWPKSDLAAYVHDLMISPTVKGERTGERLLSWVESYVRGRGRRLVRLDCDANNQVLCRYYENLGYRRVGTEGAFALFEKSL